MISHPRHPSVAFFFLPTLALALVFQGCSQPDLPLPEAEAHTAEIASWQAQRVEGLETPLGWLSVIGLTWLEPGENPFGSDPANFVRFPEALSPPRAGSFFLEEEVVRMEVEPEVEVTLDGEPVTSLVLHSAAGGRPATVWMGSLAWRVIQREDLIGVRVRDTLNAARFEFEGIETFPVSLDWVVPAHFHRHLVPRTIHVPNVLGLTASTGLSAQQVAWLPDPAQEEAFMEVYHSISSHDLMGYVEEMSSDKYRGRLPGSPEYMQVAQWVADHLAEWGIQPAGDRGSYFQMFDMPYSDVKSAGALSVEIGSGDQGMILNYSFPDDYYPGTNSDAGTVTGEVVYVGYGVTAPELGYDDYAGVDVRGKIVVIESGVPYAGNDEDTTVAWVPYSYHQLKLDNASRHGAAGLLYVGKTANPNTSFNEGLVYCHIDAHVADHLFYDTGKTHQGAVEEMRSSMSPVSMPLGKRATITAEIERHPEGRTANVVGMIEGSDPVLKDEVIIVGGHLD
ncbi:PA domain-containing protein, partial [Gemmatimonadota bacterium]